MQRFLKKVTTHLLIPFGGIYVVAFFLQGKLDAKIKTTQISSEYVEWNDVFDGNINANLVILGSSRAWVHIDPRKMDSAFGMKSYNLGMAAYSFDGQYARLQSYLDNNTFPQVILHCVDYNTLCKTKSLFRINQFIPYYDHKEVRNFLEGTDQLSFLDFHLPLFKYRWISNHSSCLLTSGLWLKANLTNSENGNGKYRGFQAQHSNWNDPVNVEVRKNTKVFDYEIDRTLLKEFLSMVERCKKSRNSLVLVYPPEFSEIRAKIENYDGMVDYYKELAKQNGLLFLDYRNHPICNDTSYFYDYRHLNSRGVDIFNAALIKDLKQNFHSLAKTNP